MTIFDNDDFFRRLHALWFGSEIKGRISGEMKLRLLTLLQVITPEEELVLRKEFGELFEDLSLRTQSENASITLSRLREIERRALQKLKNYSRPEAPPTDEDSEP